MLSHFKPVSKAALIIFIVLFLLFFVHALTDADGFLLLDYVNLPIHELGHIVFSAFGEWMEVLGGTILELLIPFLMIINFIIRREALGAAFGVFWFGENFLYISVYIADARRMELPLVGGGGHDWNAILSRLNMLKYDTLIAELVRTFGWIIMIASLLWLIFMFFAQES